MDVPILPTSDKLVENIEEIISEEDLLLEFNILEVDCRKEIIKLIREHAPLS